jgi:hypothetical protein
MAFQYPTSLRVAVCERMLDGGILVRCLPRIELCVDLGVSCLQNLEADLGGVSRRREARPGLSRWINEVSVVTEVVAESPHIVCHVAELVSDINQGRESPTISGFDLAVYLRR